MSPTPSAKARYPQVYMTRNPSLRINTFKSPVKIMSDLVTAKVSTLVCDITEACGNSANSKRYYTEQNLFLRKKCTHGSNKGANAYRVTASHFKQAEEFVPAACR